MQGIANEKIFFKRLLFFSFISISDMVKIPRTKTLNGEVKPIHRISIKIHVRLKTRKLKKFILFLSFLFKKIEPHNIMK